MIEGVLERSRRVREAVSSLRALEWALYNLDVADPDVHHLYCEKVVRALNRIAIIAGLEPLFCCSSVVVEEIPT
jgi:hypothetical protein